MAHLLSALVLIVHPSILPMLIETTSPISLTLFGTQTSAPSESRIGGQTVSTDLDALGNIPSQPTNRGPRPGTRTRMPAQTPASRSGHAAGGSFLNCDAEDSGRDIG
jgi:hypothetical protein